MTANKLNAIKTVIEELLEGKMIRPNPFLLSKSETLFLLDHVIKRAVLIEVGVDSVTPLDRIIFTLLRASTEAPL